MLIETLINKIRQRAVGKKKVVFVSGIFNIVHPGHLRLLRFASELGDYLIVGVHSDSFANSSARIREDSRLEAVSALSWVDYSFILTEPPEAFINAMKPDIVVMGKEHENKYNTEREAVETYGGELVFGSGDTTFSSLELLKEETELFDTTYFTKPSRYLDNHKITTTSLKNTIKKFNNLRVCVIGDLIVDEYVQCDPLGMSQEDPTIVVTPIKSNRFIGGGGIVAAHARGLGAQEVHFLSVAGNDDAKSFAKENLVKYNVRSELFIDESRPTTIKKRYRVGNKTMLRVNHLRQHKINIRLEESIIKHFESIVEKIDLLIFSDFNYGVLTQELVEEISTKCRKKGVIIAADSQSSSQIGDVSRYKNVALLTPTEREARLALGNFDDGLVVLAQSLQEKSNAETIIITLGAEGLLVHAGNPEKTEWKTDNIKAINKFPKDTAGAGDCLLTCTAMAIASGATIWESIYLGSLAAACQVGRVGNTPLSATELKELI